MTDEKRPLKVFLCHAHSDKNSVLELYQRLQKDGVDVWFDKEKLIPGQDWELEIRKAVHESDVVVVCLSKQFNQAGFRQKEVRLALDTAMEKPEGEIFVIPARLEECDTLESLRKWHWVDLFDENGYENLMRSLKLRAAKLERMSAKTPKVEGHNYINITATQKSEPRVATQKPTPKTPYPQPVPPLTLSAERKLDVLGIFLALDGLAIAMAVFSVSRNSTIGALLSVLDYLFGYGMYVLPVTLIGFGVWLVIRKIDSIPSVSMERIFGIMLLLLLSQTAIHGLTDYGGWVGNLFYPILYENLGIGGTITVMIAWGIFGLSLVYKLSVAELILKLNLFRKPQEKTKKLLK